MALQTVKVKLPGVLYRRLERAAVITRQSLDAVLLQTIRGNLPPLLEDVPANERAELRALLDLGDDDLWAVARSSIDPKRWQRHQRLLRRNAVGTLSEREQAELARLRAETDHQVLRKSFALALLKWRGYALPSLDAQVNNVAAKVAKPSHPSVRDRARKANWAKRMKDAARKRREHASSVRRAGKQRQPESGTRAISDKVNFPC